VDESNPIVWIQYKWLDQIQVDGSNQEHESKLIDANQADGSKASGWIQSKWIDIIKDHGSNTSG
jgi:hypothetical protein